MSFKTLPQELVLYLIKDEKDALTPLVEERASVISNTPCMRCGAAMQPHLHAPDAFSSDDPLPRQHARCVECGLIWDPKTDLVLDTGDPRKIEEALPIVRPKED